MITLQAIIEEQHDGLFTDKALNGEEAVNMVKERLKICEICNESKSPYCLIFMDCNMPIIDGFEATRIIRNLEQDLSKRMEIIALTAYSTDVFVQKSLKSGMNGFISKPVMSRDIDEILDRVFIKTVF